MLYSVAGLQTKLWVWTRPYAMAAWLLAYPLPRADTAGGDPFQAIRNNDLASLTAHIKRGKNIDTP
jgi:hypothetical protein